jgi:hypothetical protein
MRGRLALLAYRCGLGKPIGHKGRKGISSVWRGSPLSRGSLVSLYQKNPRTRRGEITALNAKILLLGFLSSLPHPSQTGETNRMLAHRFSTSLRMVPRESNAGHRVG